MYMCVSVHTCVLVCVCTPINSLIATRVATARAVCMAPVAMAAASVACPLTVSVRETTSP